MRRGFGFCLPVLSLSEVLRDLESPGPSVSPDASSVTFFKCWHCHLPLEPIAVGVQICRCSAGIHVLSSSEQARVSICRADVGQVGASPLGLRLSTPSDHPGHPVGQFSFSAPGVSSGLSSSDPLNEPIPLHSTHAPKDSSAHQVARGPLMPFLEHHGSFFLSALADGHSAHAPQAGTLDEQALSAAPQNPGPGSQRRLGFSPSIWCGLLNLSAYKALHPDWDQERDLLHLAEGLEELCQEGTLEYWTLDKSLAATATQDHSLETWTRIARASEDLVYSRAKGKPRTFKFVSANVTSWRPEIRQWLVSHQFDVALIQEHHLSETAFHAESVALSKAGTEKGSRRRDGLC